MDQPERKRRGPLTWLADRTWRFWIGVALLPVLYVASFGPVAWMLSRGWMPDISEQEFELFYWPIAQLYDHGPKPIHDSLDWYLEIGQNN